MNVICIEEEAFYELLRKVKSFVSEEIERDAKERYIIPEEAMKMLNIKSKTTLQKLRDTGEIAFSQNGKMILYDRQSIEEYLEKYAVKTFKS